MIGRKSEPFGIYGISRVDNKKGHYWFVRLDFHKGKPKIQKVFYDSTYGSITISFEAAVKFRDENMSKKLIDRRARRYAPIENFTAEHYGSKEFRGKWQKERIARRLEAIKKFGRTKIYLGTGIDAAIKARKLGASNVTCWKIKTGRTDSYLVYNCMPGVDLVWNNRKNGKKADIERQKGSGKNRFILGVGREAAIEAQKMGANQTTCLKIYRGKQNFFKCCHVLPYFEVNGFKRELTPEIINEINIMARLYAPDNYANIIQETMLNYISRNEIPNNKSFIKNLVLKYIRISKYPSSFLRRKISLDINGNIIRE